MSNWGIGLLFTFGPGGQPEVLLLRDVEAHCPACGKEAIMRYYDAAPFHTLTVRALRAILDRSGAPFAAECTQCEAAVGDEHVVRWVLHFGFPSLRGLIQGFADADGTRRWLLSPHEQIDVQLVPRWHLPGDESRREVEALDEAAVMSTFGRAFNAKEVARRALSTPDAHGAQPHSLGPALAVAIMPAGTPMTDVLERANRLPRPEHDDGAFGDVGPRATVALANETEAQDAEQSGESTRASARPADWIAEPLCLGGVLTDGYAGAAAGWLAGLRLDEPEAVDVWGLADASAVLPAARHIVKLFPVQVGFEERADGVLAMLLDDGGAQQPEIDARGVAREAARTLLDVADTTRLEIDRLLHALTGLWDGEAEEGSDLDGDGGASTGEDAE